jgi:hypothetical protein
MIRRLTTAAPFRPTLSLEGAKSKGSKKDGSGDPVEHDVGDARRKCIKLATQAYRARRKEAGVLGPRAVQRSAPSKRSKP